MEGYSTCDPSGCHGGNGGGLNDSFDTLGDHNINRDYAGTPGRTDTVYLNNQTTINVTGGGTLVLIASRVNDTIGAASKVGGAEYYIDIDPGQGRGIHMDATDGQYDAINGTWENVNATIDTSSLPLGLHTVFVRGMDIGKQWSGTKSATMNNFGGQNCVSCHSSYNAAVLSTRHNQSLNPTSPNCTLCHTGYDVQHTGFVVNESNTCRNCHIQNESGFYERHSGSSDCTSCHFANTTQKFDKNQSLYTHDHNLTVEHNFYEYNQSGIPVRINNGTGVGMFPYYTCTLTCHKYNATTGVEGKIDEAAKSWLQSKHAQSLHYPAANDNKNNCAKCKSPVNYNESLKAANPNITVQDWQGIQCRVCHNLHDRRFPNNTGPGGFPVAFYNGTASSLNGHVVYDQVTSATALCEKCHIGLAHDSKFAGTHKDTAGFNCTNCHMNSSFNNELHKFEVKNTTSGITGCEVCHNAADHTFQFTSMHIGKVQCVACHDQTISKNASGYASSPDNYYGIYKDLTINEWTTYKLSHGTAATWPLHNVTRSVSCDKCHGANSLFSGPIAIEFPVGDGSCAQCHLSYVNAVNNSMHNQTKNIAAPACTSCHMNYNNTGGHNGFVVNESNTCRNCHAQNESGFYERHTSSSDCTACHFANTTQSFSLNVSLYTHDHNLTVEHNFYEYNLSGMPVRTNNGTGLGMFPYYACTLTCHKYNATIGVEGKIDEAAVSWFSSSHARSLHMIGDNKVMCAKCKSPANYNATANQSSLIAQEDWQGIQCRVCHNLHDRKFPNNTGPSGFPVASYNGTASSLSGHAVYDQVQNATELCQKCHTGTSHDSKFAGTHKNAPLNFTCTSCHMNSSFSSELHVFEVKNTTSGVTGCEVCHDSADHTFQYTSEHTGKVECVACHDQTVSRNATGFAVSPDNNYGIYKDTTTNEWTTYKVSHSAPATWPLHNVTRSVNCDKCHGTTSVYSGPIAPMGQGCIDCHKNISSSDLGLHSLLNGTSSEDNGDCQTCHFALSPMVKGAVNNSNTYFCADCHTAAGTGPNKSSPARTFEDKKHGANECLDCHAADGIYHQGNPRGSVANATYIARYNTSNTIATDCADCHYSANLDDAPFNAPGGGQHISSQGGACAISCHPNGGDMIKTMHNISAMNSSVRPTISVPQLGYPSVNRGTDVNITARVDFTGLYAFVDGAQYRVMFGINEVRPWTPMSALDGNFNGSSEIAVAIINTDIAPGNYTVQVRGMAGGPSQNSSLRYYPMNGDVSGTNSTNLTIQAQMGYINGTVRSGGLPIDGVRVSAGGVSATTGSNGAYSLNLSAGTYNVTASKPPRYYDSSATGVVVTSGNTTLLDLNLTLKPTGTITGIVYMANETLPSAAVVNIAILTPSPGEVVAGNVLFHAIEDSGNETSVTQVKLEFSKDGLNFSLIDVQPNIENATNPNGVDSLGAWNAIWNTSLLIPGSYFLRANMSDVSGTTASHTIPVVVDKIPVPNMTIAIERGTGNATFNGSGSFDNRNIVKYEWDFGDGQNATGSTVSHTYMNITQDYFPTLTVVDDYGFRDTEYFVIPALAFWQDKPATPVDDCVPDKIELLGDTEAAADTTTIDFGVYTMPGDATKKKLGPFNDVNLGNPGPYNLAYWFEVKATLKEGSDPMLCKEKQEIKRTFHYDSVTGNDPPPDGYNNRTEWSPDDYTAQSNVKEHDGVIRWLDAPGWPGLHTLSKKGVSTSGDAGVYYDLHFKATVTSKDGLTSKECTWDVNMKVNNKGEEVTKPKISNPTC